MTDSSPTPPQIDMSRVVQRAAQAGGSAVAHLAEQLATAQELADVRAEYIDTLRTDASARDAELGQVRLANEQLQERIRQLEQPGEDQPGEDEPLTGGDTVAP